MSFSSLTIHHYQNMFSVWCVCLSSKYIIVYSFSSFSKSISSNVHIKSILSIHSEIDLNQPRLHHLWHFIKQVQAKSSTCCSDCSYYAYMRFQLMEHNSFGLIYKSSSKVNNKSEVFTQELTMSNRSQFSVNNLKIMGSLP